VRGPEPQPQLRTDSRMCMRVCVPVCVRVCVCLCARGGPGLTRVAGLFLCPVDPDEALPLQMTYTPCDQSEQIAVPLVSRAVPVVKELDHKTWLSTYAQTRTPVLVRGTRPVGCTGGRSAGRRHVTWPGHA
jgi:hypothetical protein